MNWQKVWPKGSADFSRLDLRNLDDVDFEAVRKQIKKRVRRTSSRSKAHNLARSLTIKRRSHKRIRYSKTALLARYKDCEFLNALVINRKSRWKRRLKDRKHGVHIACKDFSFIDNPIGTLRTLRNIAEAECEAVNFRIDFLDPYVTDIGPFLVLGMMRESMAPFVSGGVIQPRLAKIIEAVRLREHLRMKSFGKVSASDVWPLPLTHRRRSGSSTTQNVAYQPTTVERTADAIVEKVSLWLDMIQPPYELTNVGASKIKSMVGEILNNAERHGRSGGDGEWITAGFMARRKVSESDQNVSHICNLCFFNPGFPLGETIVNGPANIKVQVQRYRAMHKSSGLSDETLASVLALQDGISRVEQDDDDQPSGGTGLMDVVEFCNEIGQTFSNAEMPKIVIISGGTYIRFEDPYMYGKDRHDEDRRIQWFNPANDGKTAPERSHVTDLDIRFPGTLVTVRFALDGTILDEGNRDDNGEN